jgi:hypothetical protein
MPTPIVEEGTWQQVCSLLLEVPFCVLVRPKSDDADGQLRE